MSASVQGAVEGSAVVVGAPASLVELLACVAGSAEASSAVVVGVCCSAVPELAVSELGVDELGVDEPALSCGEEPQAETVVRDIASTSLASCFIELFSLPRGCYRDVFVGFSGCCWRW